MTSRLRHLAVMAVCVSVTVSGCAFGGLNSLPLPGTVGHEPGASKYTVELANVSTLEPNSPVFVGDVVVGSVAAMTVPAMISREYNDRRRVREVGSMLDQRSAGRAGTIACHHP